MASSFTALTAVPPRTQFTSVDYVTVVRSLGQRRTSLRLFQIREQLLEVLTVADRVEVRVDGLTERGDGLVGIAVRKGLVVRGEFRLALGDAGGA
jgi:hypothetical protein